MFEPENSLEALMQAAGKDPGVAPAFYQALLATEIYVLTPEVPVKPGRRRSLKVQEKINVATVGAFIEDMMRRSSSVSGSSREVLVGEVEEEEEEEEEAAGAARARHSRSSAVVLGSHENLLTTGAAGSTG